MQSKKYLVRLLCYVMQFMSQLTVVPFFPPKAEFQQSWIQFHYIIYSDILSYIRLIYLMNVSFSKTTSFDVPLINVRVFTKSGWDDIYKILQLQNCPEYQVGIKCCFEMLNLKLSVLRQWIGRLNNLGKPNPLKARLFKGHRNERNSIISKGFHFEPSHFAFSFWSIHILHSSIK